MSGHVRAPAFSNRCGIKHSEHFACDLRVHGSPLERQCIPDRIRRRWDVFVQQGANWLAVKLDLDKAHVPSSKLLSHVLSRS
jgi:hypothetical protein